MIVTEEIRLIRERRRRRDANWPVAVRTARAYASLCQRLLDGDGPDDDGEYAEHAWSFGLTRDERAALSALRGANLGPDPRQHFTSDHPIVVFFKRNMRWVL